MSSETLAPWAVRAAIAGLPSEQARELVESDRFPEPDPREDRWEASTGAVRLAEGDEVIVYHTEKHTAWLQSNSHVVLEEMQ